MGNVSAPPAPPPSLEELQAIPLGRHESLPEFATSDAAPTGETCPKCGEGVYASISRCPRCGEAYDVKQRLRQKTGPAFVRVRGEEKRARRAGPLAVGLAVALLGGLGAIYWLVLERGGGPAGPAAAVDGFLTDLLEGEVATALQALHPRHRASARAHLARYRKSGLADAEIARRVIRHVGRGDLAVQIGASKRIGDGRWNVEAVLNSRGVAVRKTWVQVARAGDRWLVDSNLFADLDRKRAVRVAKKPPLPPVPVPLAAVVVPPLSPPVPLAGPPLPPLASAPRGEPKKVAQ
jgi:hypothetical protein